MQEFIIQTINQWGYFGIFLLIAIENLFPPIPSEAILTFAGFLTTYSTLNVPGVIAASTAGSLLGALILYGVGRLLNPEKLERLLGSKWGRTLRFKKEDVTRSVNWFERKGGATVFFCRFVPIVRSLISIPAGITKMPLMKFLLFSAGGTLIWNTVLVLLGSLAGASWEKIVAYMAIYSELFFVFFVLCGIGLSVIYYRKRIKRSK